jgi:hypothetical protein
VSKKSDKKNEDQQRTEDKINELNRTEKDAAERMRKLIEDGE